MTATEKLKEKILVCEFITAGGLHDSHFGGDGQTLPASLLKEGGKMRDALLHDLSELQQYELLVMQDARLPPASGLHQSIIVDSNDFRKALQAALEQVDYVWLIAPETNAALIELTELCLAEEEKENGAIFLGCGYDATLTGTSKTLCFEALQAAGIYTLPVFGGDDLLDADLIAQAIKQHDGKWVAKPEDGAGCEGIRLFDSLPTLRDWLVENACTESYLAQPYQAGIAASISMLCRDGKAWILSCNTQKIVCENDSFTLTGVVVNGQTHYWQRFETIGRKIAQMLPDALGYVGVDVIIDTENDKIYVLEINPRLTTSYVGLEQAIALNPAKLILDGILASPFVMPKIAKNVVEVAL